MFAAEKNPLLFKYNSCDTVPYNDPILLYLSTVNLNTFLNNPIDSFLVTINRQIDSLHVSSCGSTKEGLYLACYLQVEYGTSFVKDFTIRFYVNNFTHMTRYSQTRTWNPSLMRQENIYRMEIYYLYDLINKASL